MDLWLGLGILLMVLRAGLNSGGENLQRYAQNSGSGVLNFLGVLLSVVSAPMDAVAYNIAPQSVLAPVGMIGIFFNLVAAQKVHGDPLSVKDILASTLIASGVISCILGRPSGDTDNAPFPTTALFQSYVLVVAAVCVLLAAALVILRDVRGTLDAFAQALLAGLLGSTTVVASKVIGAALTASDATRLSILLSVVPIATLAPIHMYVMNRGFGRYPLVFLSPVMGASGLLSNVATGCYLYSEVPASPAWFAGGVCFICLGVLSMCTWSSETSTAKTKKVE